MQAKQEAGKVGQQVRRVGIISLSQPCFGALEDDSPPERIGRARERPTMFENESAAAG